MNRMLLFLSLLCMSWVARGQSAYQWSCWFDADDGIRQTGTTLSAERFGISADASGLDEGLHTLHVQVADAKGNCSAPTTRLFYRVADRSSQTLRYWFDGDTEHVQTTPLTRGSAAIGVTHLTPGIHFVCCQVQDGAGNLTDVVSRCFVRQMRTDAATWSYWFDDDDAARQTVALPGEAVMIDVSKLTDGFHTIHQQMGEGAPSNVVTKMFIKVPQTENVPDMTCLCTFDEKVVASTRVSAAGGLIIWNIDVDTLGVGMHRAVFQVITPSGAASTIAERFFVRAMTTREVAGMKCLYTLDDQHTSAQAGSLSDGLFHFDLDVAKLEDGLHRVSYMLVSEDGVITPQKTAFFWKTPLGGAGIVQYDYWLNDDEAHMHSMRLDKHENPFRLISLLPVETQPIRSSNFKFEVTDGQPTVYARNDLHLRFFDTSGHAISETRQYVDYQVGSRVTDLVPISSGERKTIDVPAQNQVRWFCFEAAPGDTIAFRASQATTLQVFGPDGKELYAAQGSESVVYGGCHTWQDGTHYMALHDVTGTKPTVTIDYFHMDKYDVVRQDVHAVGNGGCSTITFDGNGFRDLYAVDLFTARGDSIHHVDIGHESDAQTTVTFDFTGVALGDYDAVFHFATEDKTFGQIITVEEARDIELATTVAYPSTFLRGQTATYTIKITNRGNMTAYMVPIYAYIENRSEEGITHIRIDGLNLPALFDGVDKSEMSQADLVAMAAAETSAGDEHYLIRQRAYSEVVNDSVCIRSGYLFATIQPNSTKVITLTLRATETVEAWVTVPTEWNSMISDARDEAALSRSASVKRGRLRDEYCCVQSKIECVGDVIAKLTDLASKIASVFKVPQAAALSAASCVADVIHDGITLSGYVFCSDKNEVEDRFWEMLKNSMNAISLPNTVAKCVQRFLPGGLLAEHCKNWSDLSKVFVVHDLLTTAGSCVEAFQKKIPGCPPIPPKGGSSNAVNSYDPNDIHGYLAESGSNAIRDSLTNVSYTIEFENDPDIATASAHDIYLTDTLDALHFNLSTFAPTRVKIGEKMAELKGDKNFVTTIDMRPEINAIAQVEGWFDEKTGIARWHVSSLDPSTVEPTDDPMCGVLPVNGTGEVSFDIQLRPDLAHGAEVKNQAGIVFDMNDAILTPCWTNVVDKVKPRSRVTGVEQLSDSAAMVAVEAVDELSGPWRYDVYVQYGAGAAWWKAAENVPADSMAVVKIYEGIDHGFYVVATDSAGNVEHKQAMREMTLNLSSEVRGDVNVDGQVGIADIVAVTGYMAGTNGDVRLELADMNGDGQVGIADILAITDIMAGTTDLKASRTRRYDTCIIKNKTK